LTKTPRNCQITHFKRLKTKPRFWHKYRPKFGIWKSATWPANTWHQLQTFWSATEDIYVSTRPRLFV